MVGRKSRSVRRNRAFVKGGGVISSVINKAVDLLPFEAHLPGYNYCGPGTKLQQRLARGDKGINGLDEACKIHDVAYSKYKDSTRRSRADKELADRAWRRFKASDSSVGEKAAAWAVTTAMKAKSKLGGGGKRKKHTGRVKRRRTTPSGKGLYLRPYTTRGSGGKKKRKVTKKKRGSR